MMVQPDWLGRQASARGGHAAVVTEEGVVSFAQLERRVAVFAARLAEIRPGASVAIVLENGLPLVEAVLACVRLGRPAISFDPRLGLGEARPLAASTVPGVVIASGATRDLARAVAREVTAELFCFDTDTHAANGARLPGPGIDLDSVALVVFSSGTSGSPKPIELTAGNLLWSALGSAARLGSRPDDRWLACLPLSHLGGLSILFRTVLLGSTMILHRGFDLPGVRHALAEEGTTMVSLVPTTLARLLDGSAVSAPALRCALIGGASAPLDLLERARAGGLPAAPTYGLTETASQVATLGPDEVLGETGRVGAPLLPTEVAIVDPVGQFAGAGEVGQIQVRGATVSRAALAPDGWLHTGDLGRIDSSGALTVLGRHDDVIVTGGENVSPVEVETVLARVAGVAEVAVARVADPVWGQVVGAWVVPNPGASLTLAHLREACRETLATHKRPRRLTLVDALPRTALGKIRRQVLASLREP